MNDNKDINKSGISLTKSDLIAFAYDVGASIAIPLIILGFGGALLDKKLESSPVFLISGLLLSLVGTSIIIAKKVKKFSNFD